MPGENGTLRLCLRWGFDDRHLCNTMQSIGQCWERDTFRNESIGTRMFPFRDAKEWFACTRQQSEWPIKYEERGLGTPRRRSIFLQSAVISFVTCTVRLANFSTPCTHRHQSRSKPSFDRGNQVQRRKTKTNLFVTSLSCSGKSDFGFVTFLPESPRSVMTP